MQARQGEDTGLEGEQNNGCQRSQADPEVDTTTVQCE